MNTVQKIRDEEALRKCYAITREHDWERKRGAVYWKLLLYVGFSTSLRISDIKRMNILFVGVTVLFGISSLIASQNSSDIVHD